jgi:hypothetical protein
VTPRITSILKRRVISGACSAGRWLRRADEPAAALCGPAAAGVAFAVAEVVCTVAVAVVDEWECTAAEGEMVHIAEGAMEHIAGAVGADAQEQIAAAVRERTAVAVAEAHIAVDTAAAAAAAEDDTSTVVAEQPCLDRVLRQAAAPVKAVVVAAAAAAAAHS